MDGGVAKAGNKSFPEKLQRSMVSRPISVYNK
jgi:hypothetical protein